MKRNIKSRKKVLIALSGGVDSAAAAALLKKQRFDVLGVHLRLFSGKQDKKASGNAKMIAGKLGISFREIDARKEFQKKIIDYFISSYKRGITPNPCVACNKEIKFRLLLDLLKKQGADYVATGHYARISKNPNFKIQNQKSKKTFKLLQATDKQKDQSYFLYKMSQRELSKTIFPLGDHTKVEVKEMAKKLKLPIKSGDESQDICFLLGNDLRLYLKKFIKLKPGNIIGDKKIILGKHVGLPLYTIGQRKGIAIGPPTSRQEREAIRASGPGPYFVIGKNTGKNKLLVSNDPKKLLTKRFFADKVDWIDAKIRLPLKVQVQIRYHADKFPAIIKSGKSGNLIIETKKSLRAVTPGQSVVFYKKEEVLGGGIII
jgi:tRNA-uridine 2-sulfurtransferase